MSYPKPPDPIATLRAYASRYRAYASRYDAAAVAEALAELERRARIEARRDAFGISRHTPPNESQQFHRVEVLTMPSGRWVSESGPDYHTALEAALNAAGAP